MRSLRVLLLAGVIASASISAEAQVVRFKAPNGTTDIAVSAANPLPVTGDSGGGGGTGDASAANQTLQLSELQSIHANIGEAVATPSNYTLLYWLKTVHNDLVTISGSTADSPVTNGSTALTVQPGNTPNTTPWLVQAVPGTANGLSTYTPVIAASDNHAVIKAGAGQVYNISAFNNSATINYVRLYDATTGFNGCNSATNLKWQGMIPASTSGSGFMQISSVGVAFATGISICVTSGFGQTDTTSATASAITLNVGYK